MCGRVFSGNNKLINCKRFEKCWRVANAKQIKRKIENNFTILWQFQFDYLHHTVHAVLLYTFLSFHFFMSTTLCVNCTLPLSLSLLVRRSFNGTHFRRIILFTFVCLCLYLSVVCVNASFPASFPFGYFPFISFRVKKKNSQRAVSERASERPGAKTYSNIPTYKRTDGGWW